MLEMAELLTGVALCKHGAAEQTLNTVETDIVCFVV